MKDRVMMLIPAKKDSKRVPGKNMKKLNGRPLLWYAIERCLPMQNDIYISTDSREIMDFIRNTYLEKLMRNISIIPRSEELTQDERLINTITHAIDYTEFCLSKKYTTLIMTLATSPFATSSDIWNAYQIFIENDRKPIMSVTKYSVNPYLAIYKDVEKRLFPRFVNWPLQGADYMNKDCYFHNGAVWICDIEQFRKEKEQYIYGSLGYEMPPERGLEIDEPLDWLLAEALMEKEGKRRENEIL